MRFRFSLFLVLLLASQCVLAQSETGPSLAETAADSLHRGQSTKRDVLRLLGPPNEIIYSNREHDALQEAAYRYTKTRTRQTAMFLILFSTYRSDAQADELLVFFDDHGRVSDFGARFCADASEYGMPW